VELIDLAQDRGRWQDDVNAIINLQGEKNAGNSAALK
jgi:hypothetical protein